MSSAVSRQIYCCLVALMLLIVRTADAHAHLCADGKEPPVSIHLGNCGAHPCDGEPSVDHGGDKNVQIGGDVVLKKAPSFADPPMPALLAYAFDFDFVAPCSKERILIEPNSVRVEPPAYLRPPLRGPPA